MVLTRHSTSRQGQYGPCSNVPPVVYCGPVMPQCTAGCLCLAACAAAAQHACLQDQEHGRLELAVSRPRMREHMTGKDTALRALPLKAPLPRPTPSQSAWPQCRLLLRWGAFASTNESCQKYEINAMWQYSDLLPLQPSSLDNAVPNMIQCSKDELSSCGIRSNT
nr:hypothetical protein CFP56_54508 [Quercus suber]